MPDRDTSGRSALTYPADLTPEIQSTLASLADLETRYEIDREAAERTTRAAEQAHLLDQLEKRRQVEREPLVRRLAELQQAMTFALMHRAWATDPEEVASRYRVEVERTGDRRQSASERSA